MPPKQPGASDKLRELRIQMQQQDSELQSLLQPSKAAGGRLAPGQAAADPGERDAELRAKLRQQQSYQASLSERLPHWKLGLIVVVAALVAVILLVVLFTDAAAPQYEDGFAALGDKPLTAAELKERNPAAPCPDPLWIPTKCLNRGRLQDAKQYHECQRLFDQYQWSKELLKKCRILPP